MFTFYIENHEPFESLTKNCPKLDKNKSMVSRFSVFNLVPREDFVLFRFDFTEQSSVARAETLSDALGTRLFSICSLQVGGS